MTFPYTETLVLALVLAAPLSTDGAWIGSPARSRPLLSPESRSTSSHVPTALPMAPPSSSSGMEALGFGSNSKKKTAAVAAGRAEDAVKNTKTSHKKKKGGLAEAKELLQDTTTSSNSDGGTTSLTAAVPDAIQEALAVFNGIDKEQPMVDADRFASDMEFQQIELGHFDSAKQAPVSLSKTEKVFQVSSNMASLEKDYQNDQLELADEGEELSLTNLATELDATEPVADSLAEDYRNDQVELVDEERLTLKDISNELDLDDAFSSVGLRGEAEKMAEEGNDLMELVLEDLDESLLENRDGASLLASADPSADYDEDMYEYGDGNDTSSVIKTRTDSVEASPEVEFEDIVTGSFADVVEAALKDGPNQQNEEDTFEKVDMNAFVVGHEKDSLEAEYNNDELVFVEEEQELPAVGREINDCSAVGDHDNTIALPPQLKKNMVLSKPSKNTFDGVKLPRIDFQLPGNPFEGMELPNIDFKMPKLDLSEEHIQEITDKAQASARSIFQLGQEATKLMVDEAKLLKQSIKTTNVKTLSRNGYEITYEEAFEKVTKSGEGLFVLAKEIGGIVQASVASVDFESKLQPSQPRAIFQNMQRTLASAINDFQSTISPKTGLGGSATITLPAAEPARNVEVVEPAPVLGGTVYVEDEKGNFKATAQKPKPSFMKWQTAAMEAMTKFENVVNQHKTNGEAILEGAEATSPNWQNLMADTMTSFQAKTATIKKVESEHDEEDDADSANKPPFFFAK